VVELVGLGLVVEPLSFGVIGIHLVDSTIVVKVGDLIEP